MRSSHSAIHIQSLFLATVDWILFAYSFLPSSVPRFDRGQALTLRLMSTNLPDFPIRIPEKLKTIRERLGLTPEEIAVKVGARTSAEILAYESDKDDLLVTVLWAYSKLAGCPIDSLLYDHLEGSFRGLRTV